MKYKPTIYKANPDDSSRFVLGTAGKNPLFVIGLNPSTADRGKSDRTVSKVMRFAVENDHDSFVMFNLYPQRTTDPNGLHLFLDSKLHDQNICHIMKSIEQYNEVSILAAWGGLITIRGFFRECLADIHEKTKAMNINWLAIGLTKNGHPRHPSRAGYCKYIKFDIHKYLTSLK